MTLLKHSAQKDIHLIISFDPGISTGVVTATNVNYITRTYDLGPCAVVMYPDRHLIMEILARNADQLEQIIIENFRLFPNKAQAQSYSEFEAVKVIERITVYCEQLELAHLVTMQEPSVRLSAKGMPEDHAKIIRPNRHLTAAYQHCRFYIFMHKHSSVKT